MVDVDRVQVGAACLTDLTAAEEACCTASLQVAVTGSGSLCGMTKQGQAAFSPDLLLVGACIAARMHKGCPGDEQVGFLFITR